MWGMGGVQESLVDDLLGVVPWTVFVGIVVGFAMIAGAEPAHGALIMGVVFWIGAAIFGARFWRV